jgi:hypothetical protein
MPVRLRRHVAPTPWPPSQLDEPVPAVELRSSSTSPARIWAPNVVSIRRRSPLPRSTPYTANANGVATSLLAPPAMRCTKALRIAS